MIVGGPGVPVRIFPATGLRRSFADVSVALGVFVPELHEWDRGRCSVLTLPARRRCVFSYREGGEGPSETLVSVPSGFEYDGASLPVSTLVRILAGPRERYELAGLVHDLLYRLQAPRAAADGVFRVIAESGEAHVGRLRGGLTYAALRAFGWMAYAENGRRRRAA